MSRLNFSLMLREQLIRRVLLAAFAAAMWVSSPVQACMRAPAVPISGPARDDLKAALQGELDAVKKSEISSLFDRHTAIGGMLSDLRRRERLSQLMVALDRAAGTTAVARFHNLNRQVRTVGAVPASAMRSTSTALSRRAHTPISGLLITAAADAGKEAEHGVLACCQDEIERIGFAKETADAPKVHAY